MSRGMTTDAIDVVTAETARRTLAAALDFDGGTVRLTSAPYSVFIGDDEFLGVGVLGSISVVEEAADLASYSLSLQLSGIPRDLVSVALTETYQGRSGTVWEVVLDEDFRPVANPVVVFRGRMDVMTIEIGETAAIALTLLNRLARWESPNLTRFSDEDQQRLHPGDLGCQYAASMIDRSIIWPSRGWFSAHR